jgi:hypothetical protein
MKSRTTKITKYFTVEPKDDPYYFFKKPNGIIPNSSNSNIEQLEKPLNTPSNNKYSSDYTPIYLITTYNSHEIKTKYNFELTNNSSSNFQGTIESVSDETDGDLKALYECLKYLVYNPNLTQKMNREKLLLITNSQTISNIFKPNSNLITHNEYSKLYFKIQSLLKCIKNISIEYLVINGNQ